MDTGRLWKITAFTSLGFGIYCIAVATYIILWEVVEFAIIFGLIFAGFGTFYLIAGVSMLRKGIFGHSVFIGAFGAFLWWGSGMPWYVWPLMVMPIVIGLMYVALFLQSFWQQ